MAAAAPRGRPGARLGDRPLAGEPLAAPGPRRRCPGLGLSLAHALGLRAESPRPQQDGSRVRPNPARDDDHRGAVDLGSARRAHEPQRGDGRAASPAPELHRRRRLRRDRRCAHGTQSPRGYRAGCGAVRRPVSGRLRAIVRHAGAHPRHGGGHPGADHPRLRRARARAARSRGGDAPLMSDVIPFAALLAAATARGAVPLVLAALGGLFAERSGVVDIGLEGKMLASAFAAAAAAAVTGSAWIGLGAGIVAAVLVGLLHAFACVTHRGNQVVSGMALNITLSGLTAVLGYAWFHEGGQTPLLGPGARFAPIELPGASALGSVPALGPIYREVVNGHNVLVYVAAAAVPAVAWVMYRTRFGLRLRAVGENPGAVDTAGISVATTRYRALVLSGVLCGLSGAYLSTAHHASFIRDMSAGRGYLALAALIFGQWRPVPTLGACLLFAFADAVQARLQGTELPLVGVMPVQLIQALPYVLTVLL